MTLDKSMDLKTAEAFATSWNNLPAGSVYTESQFEDWMDPLNKEDIVGQRVLELGCGSAALMVHMTKWEPSYLEGVDLGSSVLSAEQNLSLTPFSNWKITKGDLVTFQSSGFDIVYCIGVLHHLKNPSKGFESLVRNTKSGGRFHAWVYSKEGNNMVIYFVDPIRKIASKLPWWFTKYLIATPLAIPFYFYAKTLSNLPRYGFLKRLPLYEYCLWIAKREYGFFRHVAFDQLVTPQTTYISRATVDTWLKSKEVELGSAYIIQRNGNSWKFGGKKKNA